MGVNLQKGQKLDLTKGNAGLQKLVVGLGWDAIKKTGFFGMTSKIDIDCDASVIMLNANGKMSELVYFGNKVSSKGAVTHSGDNRTGEGDGDDESIIVDIAKIPENVDKLIFVVNIYDCANRKQDFGMIQNAYIRIMNGANSEELAKFNLSESYAGKTTLVTGEIYRHSGEWKFNAIGEGTTDRSLTEIVAKYK